VKRSALHTDNNFRSAHLWSRQETAKVRPIRSLRRLTMTLSPTFQCGQRLYNVYNFHYNFHASSPLKRG
jgi:hypothetical protein